MRETTEMSKDTHAEVCKAFKNDRYVDDILSSRNKTSEFVVITKGIDNVLRKGDFVIKHWVTNANLTDVPESEKQNIVISQEEKVLGIWWDLASDKLFIKARIDFTKRNHSKNFSNQVTLANIEKLFPQFLTRRMVLSQVAKLFDPLGLLALFLLKAKILMRKSFSDSKGTSSKRDEQLSTQQYQEWKQFSRELLHVEQINFPRCLRPENVVDEPMLIVFSDGSKDAF